MLSTLLFEIFNLLLLFLFILNGFPLHSPSDLFLYDPLILLFFEFSYLIRFELLEADLSIILDLLLVLLEFFLLLELISVHLFLLSSDEVLELLSLLGFHISLVSHLLSKRLLEQLFLVHFLLFGIFNLLFKLLLVEHNYLIPGLVSHVKVQVLRGLALIEIHIVILRGTWLTKR